MPNMIDKWPLIGTVDPQNTNGFFSSGGAYNRNCMLETYSDGQTYVTQRPSIQIADASPAVKAAGGARGRGIYYWADNNILLIVDDDQVLNGAGISVGTISAGKDQVWMGQLGSYVIILDQENNQGWTVDGALNVVEITDPDFPGELAGGGAVLNGVLYVMNPDGTIYNSGFLDPTTWAALDFINAEREPDGGVYITKFLDQVVAFGVNTIEFFYDSANPVGSPLSRREDLSYRIGALDYQSVYNSGDIVYFIGADVSGAVKLMALDNFQLKYLSTPMLDRYMEDRTRLGGLQPILSGAHTAGHLFVFMSFMAEIDGDYAPQETLVYDATTKLFSEYETDYPGIDFFPVMDWTIRQIDSVEFAFGIMVTGDVFRFSGSGSPVDTTVLDGYVDAGYIDQQNDYVFAEFGAENYNIQMVVRTEEWDGGNVGPIWNNNKFIHKLEITGARIAQYTDDGVPMKLRWTDDEYSSYSAFRNINVGGKQRLTRCGKTDCRAFELTYSGINRLRVQDIAIMFGVSSYA